MGRGKTNMEGLMLTPVRMKELVEFLEDKKYQSQVIISLSNRAHWPSGLF